jgi:hypothetical protein
VTRERKLMPLMQDDIKFAWVVKTKNTPDRRVVGTNASDNFKHKVVGLKTAYAEVTILQNAKSIWLIKSIS